MMVTPKPADPEVVRGLPVMRPARKGVGMHWRHLAHHEFITTVMDQCLERGWACGDVHTHLGRHGQDMSCRLDVEIPKHYPGEDFAYCLGLVNSNAQQSTTKMFLGLRYLEGGAGIPFYRYAVGRHTRFLLLPKRVRTVLNHAEVALPHILKLERRMWGMKLSEGQVCRLLFKAAEEKLMAKEHIWDVLTAWGGGEPNAGRLMWQFVRKLSQSRPFLQMDRAFRFYRALTLTR